MGLLQQPRPFTYSPEDCPRFHRRELRFTEMKGFRFLQAQLLSGVQHLEPEFGFKARAPFITSHYLHGHLDVVGRPGSWFYTASPGFAGLKYLKGMVWSARIGRHSKSCLALG